MGDSVDSYQSLGEYHAALPWWPYLLGGLALAGFAGGGGDSTPSSAPAPTNNTPPQAVLDSYTTDEDTAIRLNPLNSDQDTDGDTISITSINGVALSGGVQTIAVPNGTVTIAANGVISFIPAANYHDEVSFPYTISDGKGGTANAIQTITINAVPDLIVAGESISTNEDTPVSGSVIANDSTSSGGTLTYTQANNPSHGTVVFNSNGTYTYTPNANYNGTDTFSYTVTDAASGESATATVSITITATPEPVEAVAETIYVPAMCGGSENFLTNDLSLNGTKKLVKWILDVDGDGVIEVGGDDGSWNEIDPITGSIFGERGVYDENNQLVAQLIIMGNQDGLSVSQRYNSYAGSGISYGIPFPDTPATWEGSRILKYEITDGEGNFSSVESTLLIKRPLYAVDDEYNVGNGTSLNIATNFDYSSNSLLLNDVHLHQAQSSSQLHAIRFAKDADGIPDDEITRFVDGEVYQIYDGSGTLAGTLSLLNSTSQALADNIIFTPVSGGQFIGDVAFQYQLYYTGGALGIPDSNWATATIHVTPAAAPV